MSFYRTTKILSYFLKAFRISNILHYLFLFSYKTSAILEGTYSAMY